MRTLGSLVMAAVLGLIAWALTGWTLAFLAVFVVSLIFALPFSFLLDGAHSEVRYSANRADARQRRSDEIARDYAVQRKPVTYVHVDARKINMYK